MSEAPSSPPPRRWLRSILAIVAGFVAVVVLSIATDAALSAAHIFPPADQAMLDPKLLFCALAYRSVYGALGSYIAARLAPRAPMWHAMILGGIGEVASIAGVIAALPGTLGPIWYPVALAITTLPFAWLGGALAARFPRR